MPKRRKNQLIHCAHFKWRLVCRGGKWHADGRSNTPDAGRHSLGTEDKEEALRQLPELDRVRAEDLGLIPRSGRSRERSQPLTLQEGRKLYEKHIARPRATGGVRKSTQKRYRTVFDKFIPYAIGRGVTVFPIPKAVSAHISLGQLQDPFRRINVDDARRSGVGRVYRKGAGIGKGI